MTEKIRQLTNKVRLSGALAELDKDSKTGLYYKEGETKAGIPYISFSGAIQCGESGVNSIRFRTFVKSKKTDGTDSKNYANVKNWIMNAVPMTDDKENPTYVNAVGSIVDHPYVSRENKLIEAWEYNLQFFSDFEEYAADIDLEGFVHSITDEIKNENSTGRKVMRLITRDMFGNTLDIKRVIVPEEFVEPLDDNGYERGVTAKFFLSLIPNKSAAKTKTGGIGTQRVEGGKPYLELTLTGADPVIDSESEDALDPKLIKAAMVERQSRLDEINEAGYQGGSSKSESTVSGAARNGIGGAKVASAKAKAEVDETSDDDFPF